MPHFSSSQEVSEVYTFECLHFRVGYERSPVLFFSRHSKSEFPVFPNLPPDACSSLKLKEALS
jgi:hypothetical protein